MTNKISFAGRLAADAEVKFTPGGDPLCSFRVASDVGYGEKKSTNWFACQLWGKRAESLAPHLTKGQQVTVWGTLQLREWTNKDGAKQLSPDVRVDDVALQGGKQSGEAAPAKQDKPAQRPAPMDDFSDDSIPF
jgi:single-strand DNA-binding protein